MASYKIPFWETISLISNEQRSKPFFHTFFPSVLSSALRNTRPPWIIQGLTLVQQSERQVLLPSNPDPHLGWGQLESQPEGPRVSPRHWLPLIASPSRCKHFACTGKPQNTTGHWTPAATSGNWKPLKVSRTLRMKIRVRQQPNNNASCQNQGTIRVERSISVQPFSDAQGQPLTVEVQALNRPPTFIPGGPNVDGHHNVFLSPSLANSDSWWRLLKIDSGLTKDSKTNRIWTRSLPPELARSDCA